jgi:hypothetical protein
MKKDGIPVYVPSVSRESLKKKPISSKDFADDGSMFSLRSDATVQSLQYIKFRLIIMKG